MAKRPAPPPKTPEFGIGIAETRTAETGYTNKQNFSGFLNSEVEATPKSFEFIDKPTLIVEWQEKHHTPFDFYGKRETTVVRYVGKVDGYVSDPHGSFWAIVISDRKLFAVQLADLTIVPLNDERRYRVVPERRYPLAGTHGE